MWDTAFWRKIRQAVERVAGAAVLMVSHWLFNRLLFVVLPAWPAVEKFAFIIETAVFLIVYFVLLVGILPIFVHLPIGIGTASNRGTSDEERGAR